MNLGMIGAIGGLGQAGINQADDIRKEEAANAEMGRRKNLESWLMQAREEFAVKGEARAETRAIASEGRRVQADIAKDEREYRNETTRAPEKRQRAVDDALAKKSGELGFESANIDTMASNKSKMTEAGETQSTKDLLAARGSYYSDRGEAALAKGAGNGKFRPEVKAELDGLNAEIKATVSKIESAKINGTWEGTVDQKAIAASLGAKRLRVTALLKDAGGGASQSENSDPQGFKSINIGSKATGPTNKAEVGMAGEVRQPMGADPEALRREIASTEADLKTNLNPADRVNATAYLESSKATLARLETAKPAAAVTVASKAAAPAEAEFARNPAMDAKLAAEELQMGEGKRIRFSDDVKPYAKKVSSLREKMDRQAGVDAAFARSKNEMRPNRYAGVPMGTGL